MQNMSSPPTTSDPIDVCQPTHIHQQQVEAFLSHCGLCQYVDIFMEEGFDRLESLLEITESDLIQMQVKRGHRRLLQRAIANAKGISPHIPLNITPILNNKDVADYAPQPFQPPTQQHQMHQPPPPPAQPPPGPRLHVTNLPAPKPTNDMSPSSHPNTSSPSSATSYIPNDYSPSAGTMIHNTASGMSSTEEEAVTSDNVHRLWKRKYHRHAKPDTNAPLKPPSAYVMFSNDVRAELKQQNKSFTDLAKIIGDRWKNITPAEKEMYETIALKAREEYLKKVEEYQKTDAFKKYQQYISDFKAENEAAARPVGRPRKRHRRDEYGSDGTVSDSARPQRTSSICSQTEEAVSTNHNMPTFADQKHYPFYLLNNEEASDRP